MSPSMLWSPELPVTVENSAVVEDILIAGADDLLAQLMTSSKKHFRRYRRCREEDQECKLAFRVD